MNSVHAHRWRESRWFSLLVIAGSTLLTAFVLRTFVVEVFRIPSASMERTLRTGDVVLVNKLSYGLRTPRELPLFAITIPSIRIPLPGGVSRGDVVVFEHPDSLLKAGTHVSFIKRCVGLPGDTVEMKGGEAFVNGRRLTEPPEGVEGERNEGEGGEVIVPSKGMMVTLSSATISRWRTAIEREGHSVLAAEDGTVLVDGAISRSYTFRENHYFMLGDNRDNSLDSRSWGFVPDEFLIGRAVMVCWSVDPENGSRFRPGRMGMIVR